MSVLCSLSVDSRLWSELCFWGAPLDLMSLLPPRYLSHVDLEWCSSVWISHYIILCSLGTSINSILLIYLLFPSCSFFVQPPTFILCTLAYPSWIWTLELHPLSSPTSRGHWQCLGAFFNNFAEALNLCPPNSGLKPQNSGLHTA